MSITTFADLLTAVRSKKIFLIEIEPSERITGWSVYTGDIYQATIDVVDIITVDEDGSALTEVTSLGDISAGKWYHGKDTIYLQPTSGTAYSKVIVLNYKLYYATEDIIINSTYYEGIVDKIPVIKQEKKEIFWGLSVVSSGNITLINSGGKFDNIYKKYAWNNKPITIILGGEDLPYSEYNAVFTGLITSKIFTTKAFTIKYESKENDLQTTIPTNTFGTTEYPNLDPEDDGKVKPLVYGTVIKIPVMCTTRTLGSATSLHSFKILDTSLCSLDSITQVYVNDLSVTHQSADVPDASFKLPTSIYSPGDSVTVSAIADVSNPIEQVKDIASNVLSIPYNSNRYNTATVSKAVTDAEIFPTGLFVGIPKNFLEVIGDLMKSCMGFFDTDNAGLYTINIWSIEIEDDLTNIDFTDIKAGSFKATALKQEIRKVVRIGWRKNWEKDTYAYKQATSDTTEKIYGIKKTKTIPTLLSTVAGVNVLLGRLSLIFETETNRMSFATKVQLAGKNIGDRIQLSFKRREEDSNLEWLDTLAVEINKIVKNFVGNIITVEVDDLKGIGSNVGRWTEDNPTFPSYLGGGDVSAWDSSWSTAQKNYARDHWGFWCDDDGFAENTDSSSFKISRWW